MASVDNSADLAVNRLIEEGDLGTEIERSHFLRLLISLMRRNPQFIAHLARRWNSENNRIWREIQDNYDVMRRPQDPETYGQLLRQIDIGDKSRSFANLVVKLIDNEDLGNHLIKMPWTVIKLESRFGFITSDRPVVYASGCLRPDFYMCLALSPSCLFVSAKDTRIIENIASNSKTLSRRYNDVVARQAHDYVYAVDDSHCRFVENRLGKWREKKIVSDIAPSFRSITVPSFIDYA